MKSSLAVVLIGLSIAGCSAPTTPGQPGSVDALAGSPVLPSTRLVDPALVKVGTQLHRETRLDVPTFVWAPPQQPGLERSTVAASEAEGAARAHLVRYALLYGQSAALVESAKLLEVHDTGRGGLIARFGQQLNGIEVFRDEMKVLMGRDLSLIAIAGYLPGELNAPPFKLSAASAISAAAREASGKVIDPGVLRVAGQPGGNYTLYEVDPASELQLAPVRLKSVYFHLPTRLEPAFYLELEVVNAENQSTDLVAYVVSALDGRMLFKNALTVDASFSYRTWAENTGQFRPMDGPQGYAPTPHPTGLPDGFQAAFIPSNLVTLANTPLSTNDAWLPPGAVETNGNNADAYLDIFAPDGFSPGDFRVPVSTPGVFDYTVNLTIAPNFVQPNGARTQQHGVATTLFYTVNFLHDWYYDSGFNEISGNGQLVNYGRGGLAGDALKIEAQDYAGRNNANMSTPADGARPRMQMFLFDGLSNNKITVAAPLSLAGDYPVGTASWGPNNFALTGDVVAVSPLDACSTDGGAPINTNVVGKIAFIDRGTCGFVNKVEAAQAAGAIGVIIGNVNTSGAPTVPPGMGGVPIGTVTIPSLSLNAADATSFRTALAAGTVTVTLTRQLVIDRDGSLDTQIVAHEWGHYISNRLIGNANGLSNQVGRGMGEGWADFHAILLTVRAEDSLAPGNSQFEGVYAMAGFSTPSISKNPYYFGIRRYPYSTDMTKNPLTYKHIDNTVALPTAAVAPVNPSAAPNSQVHNTGEIWASSLWECYAALLRDVLNNTSGRGLTFDQAQRRMKDYLVAAYKMTPNAPTMIEARDAVLAVAYASDQVDYRLFAIAFAKRGMGAAAGAPDRNSTTNQGATEDPTPAIGLVYQGSSVDDSITSPCGANGALENAETGVLQVVLKSTVGAALPGSTATISSSTTGVTFPAGATLTFPPTLARGLTIAPVQVALTGLTDSKLDYTINVTNPTTGPASFNFSLRANQRITPFSSTTDDVESPRQAWDVTSEWRRSAVSVVDHRWFGPDLATAADIQLISPVLQVAATGDFGFTFRHRFGFEAATGANYDGAVIEVTANNGFTWTDVGTAALTPPYGGALATAGGNPLEGRLAFVGTSATYPAMITQTVALGTKYQGQTVRVRFRIGSDQGGGSAGWEIDDVAFTGIANTPFDTVTVSPGTCGSTTVPPAAYAGPAQTVLQNAAVTLDGSGSSSPNAGALTFAWSQAGGPAITLSTTVPAKPTFTAPVVVSASTTVATSAVLTFRLVVNDGVATSQPALTTVIVNNPNRVPAADAGVPQTVLERATVTLNGNATDADPGTALTYAWTQTAGPAAVLSSTAVAKPTFTAPDVTADSTLTFQLIASDAQVSSAPSSTNVVVKSANRVPVANAGAAQSVAERSMATLVGGASTDPDGDSITYVWTQTAGPSVGLVGATLAGPTFATPEIATDTTLTFQLVVNDGFVNSVPATVDVVVTNVNRAPVANAGVLHSGNERGMTTLDGSSSSDPEGSTLTYAWTQVSGPTAVLSSTTIAVPTVTLPEVTADTTIVFSLVVNDGTAASTPATVSIVVRDVNRTPVANAGPAASINARAAGKLDGSASTDADGDSLAYLWSQVSGPAAVLTGAATSRPSFTAPDSTADTSITFQLVVNDGKANSAPATVEISVKKTNRAPVANAGPGQTVEARAKVVLDGSGSVDPDGDILTYAWTQSSGPAATLTGATTATPSFAAPEAPLGTLMVFELVVKDADLSSAPSKVNILLGKAGNRAPEANAGSAAEVTERQQVTLDGSASKDPDGDALTYAWTQTEGTPVGLVSGTTAKPSFTAPPGSGGTKLTFQLLVSDGQRVSAASTVEITIRKGGGGCSTGGFAQPVFAGVLLLLAGLRRRRQ